jgi:hypothetical protein
VTDKDVHTLAPNLESGNRTRNAVRSVSLIRFETALNLFHLSFVLAATEYLHERIAKMGARVWKINRKVSE